MSSVGTHTITVGDTLEPLKTVLKDGAGNPYNLASYTVRFQMEQEDGTVELAATATGVTPHPTQTFTVDTSADTVLCVAHGVEEEDQIIVATATTLPGGLAASTRYFAKDVQPNSFKLSSVPGGVAIDITSAGTGAHTFYVVGSVQMDFAAAQVDTAGTFRGWWTLDSGGELKTVPEGSKWIRIVVVNKGS
jgi:hypothetical protein